MGSEDNSEMGFQQRAGDDTRNDPSSGMSTGPLSDKVSGLIMSSEAMFKSSTGVENFYGSGWDPLGTLNQSQNFGGSSVIPHTEFANSNYPSLLQNQAMSSSSHLGHYSSVSGLVDMVPKMPCFASGNFSEIVNSFGLAECGQITDSSCHLGRSQNKGTGIGKTSRSVANSQEECEKPVEGAAVALPNGKRKRRASESHSPLNTNKNSEEELKDQSEYNSESSKELEEKKREQNNSGNLRGKQAGKQAKDSSNSEEPPKENYIHVRAKRGQATNSHSLAERVRRERISERMRLLQELVPGCNKITGKAVMLDEIINYVQSLQQQVEFLSMKLATVNPELNIDIERLFSKDILHSQGSNATGLGIAPGLNSSHPFLGLPQGAFVGNPSTMPPFPPLPQTLWDSELQNILQTGFGPSPSINNVGPSGRSKLEL